MNKKLLTALFLSATATAAIADFGLIGCDKPKNDADTDDVRDNLIDYDIDNGTGTIVNPADKYTQEQITEMLAPFTYEIEGNGTYTVTGLKDNTATTITIPDCAARICEYAFSGYSSLTSVTITDGVMNIGTKAFKDCTALTNITIGGGITNISNSAFYDCTSLESVTIPDSVTSIEDYAFCGCTSLKDITIDGVTYIGMHAFNSCSSLTSVTIGNKETITNETVIGDGAFGYCTSLTNVTISSSVVKILASVFGGCTSLTSITVDEGNENYKAVDGNLYSKDGVLVQYAVGKKDASFSVPDGVTGIGGGAFDGCNSLTSVTIPDSVTYISYYAFIGCTSLENVTFENTDGWTAGNTSFLSGDLADASTAATYLTDTYCGYFWKRS